MTVKELKKEFKLRNATAKTIENLMTIPFLFCLIVGIFTFNIFMIILSGMFAIVQGILYSMNNKKWKVFLLDNKERLSEEERIKVKL